MSKKKPIYREEIGSLIPRIEFSPDQTRALNAICCDNDFVDRVREIAEFVWAINDADCFVLGVPDVSSTLADFGEGVANLLLKLDGLPQQVRALLWRAEPSLENLHAILDEVGRASASVLERIPQGKPGRKTNHTARIAARSVHLLFMEYSICYSANNWPGATCHAADCLGVVIASGVKKVLSRDTLIDYIEDEIRLSTEAGE